MTGAETVSWGRGGGCDLCFKERRCGGGVRCARAGGARWARAGGSCALCSFLSFLVGSRDWWWKGRGEVGFGFVVVAT